MSGLPIGPAAREPCARAAGHASPPAAPQLPSSPPEGTRTARPGGQAPPSRAAGLPFTLPGEPGNPPAGDAPDADDASPAGSTGLNGEQFRRAWKTARAARNYGRRRARFRRAGAQPGPGMIRRPPPSGGDAA